MAEPVTLRFRYAEQDYVRAMRLHLSRRMRFKLDVAVSVGLGLAGAYMLGSGAGHAWVWILLCVGSALLLTVALAAWFALPAFAFRQEPKLHEEYLLRFGPDGIDFQTPSIQSRIAWKLYRELRSDEHTHLLVYGTNGFTAVPRRVFASAEQEAAFLDLVRRSLGGR